MKVLISIERLMGINCLSIVAIMFCMMGVMFFLLSFELRFRREEKMNDEIKNRRDDRHENDWSRRSKK